MIQPGRTPDVYIDGEKYNVEKIEEWVQHCGINWDGEWDCDSYLELSGWCSVDRELPSDPTTINIPSQETSYDVRTIYCTRSWRDDQSINWSMKFAVIERQQTEAEVIEFAGHGLTDDGTDNLTIDNVTVGDVSSDEPEDESTGLSSYIDDT